MSNRCADVATITLLTAALLLSLAHASVAEATTMQPSYSAVIDNLRRASVPIRELGTHSKVAVTLAAGRVVAIAFSPDGQNLLWSNPQLGNTVLVKNRPQDLVGGFGGDRLWFAPELDYHWDGTPDWNTFANYKTPVATDPGNYQFIKNDSRSITVRADGELPVHGRDWRVGFSVDRTIQLVKPPLSENNPLMSAVDYIGIETSHVLKISDKTHKGLIDLWHLLQAPAGSILIVPIKNAADAQQADLLSYGLPGAWVRHADHIMWRFGGEARAKLGVSAALLTGRSAVLRELAPERWCLIVREFEVNTEARYGDHPYEVPRTDQAFQAWDGYGFGEMEYHSPVADAERGPRELKESDRLWAFGGSSKSIAALSIELLGVDVSYLFHSKPSGESK